LNELKKKYNEINEDYKVLNDLKAEKEKFFEK
jgi:hypothetical protein